MVKLVYFTCRSAAVVFVFSLVKQIKYSAGSLKRHYNNSLNGCVNSCTPCCAHLPRNFKLLAASQFISQLLFYASNSHHRQSCLLSPCVHNSIVICCLNDCPGNILVIDTFYTVNAEIISFFDAV